MTSRGIVVSLVAAVGLIACNGPGTHVLTGQLYEAARDCVDPTTSIDVVDGENPGSGCAPTCVVTPAGQNGSGAGVYVTTMCAPYPPLDDTSGTVAGCAGAFAALARGDTCLPDGTSASPADGGGASDASGE